MYIAKVYLNYQLVDVNIYEDYEHFLSDLTCKGSDLYDRIPKEKVEETDFERPWIVAGGEDSLGFGGDYEYRYETNNTNITVYCGTILTAEDLARSESKAGKKEFLDAVDAVCLDCAFGEDTCPTCPVRKTVDLAKKRRP